MLTNLFTTAIERDELLEFGLGKKSYYIVDRETGGHWILQSWKQHIVPALESENALGEKVIHMFESLLDCNVINEGEKTHLLLYHMHVYYYLVQQNTIQNANLLIGIEGRMFDQISATQERNRAQENEKENEKIDFSIRLISQNGGFKNRSTP